MAGLASVLHRQRRSPLAEAAVSYAAGCQWAGSCQIGGGARGNDKIPIESYWSTRQGRHRPVLLRLLWRQQVTHRHFEHLRQYGYDIPRNWSYRAFPTPVRCIADIDRKFRATLLSLHHSLPYSGRSLFLVLEPCSDTTVVEPISKPAGIQTLVGSTSFLSH